MKKIHPALWLTVLVIITLIISYGIKTLFISRANVLWDESVFLYWTYNTYKAVKHADLAGLWYAVRMQFGNGPLQSLVISLFLLPFKFSVENARTAGLFWYISSPVFIYILGKMFGGVRGKFMGFSAALLFIMSPYNILTASLALKEMMATSLTLVAYILYFQARKKNSTFYYLAVSLVLSAIFLTKYFSGVLLGAVFAVDALFYIVKKFSSKNTAGMKQELRHILLIVMPFIAVCLFWIFFPENLFDRFWHIFFSGVTDLTYGYPDPWLYILFYPRAIVYMYAFSIPLGIFLLLSLLVSVFYIKDPKIRIFWIHAYINMILGTFNTGNMIERYIITAVPLIYLIGAYVVTRLYEKIRPYLANTIVLSGFAIGIVILSVRLAIDCIRLPSYVYSVGSYSFKSPLFNQTDYTDLWFEYDTNKWPKQLPPAGSSKPKDVLEWIAHRVDLSKPIEIAGRANEFPTNYFDLIFALHRDNNDYPHLPYPSFTVTTEIVPSSRLYTKDYRKKNAWLLSAVRDVEQNPSFQLLARKEFTDLGVVAGIYVPK